MKSKHNQVNLHDEFSDTHRDIEAETEELEMREYNLDFIQSDDLDDPVAIMKWSEIKISMPECDPIYLLDVILF